MDANWWKADQDERREEYKRIVALKQTYTRPENVDEDTWDEVFGLSDYDPDGVCFCEGWMDCKPGEFNVRHGAGQTDIRAENAAEALIEVARQNPDEDDFEVEGWGE